MQKYKKFFVFLFLVTIFLVPTQTAFALEANYPSITLFGNTYHLTSSTSIVQLIEYFFVFLIAICGIIAVMSIVISGIKILVTAGSPGAIGEAKERILGALLGIVLLFSSVILLRTINPQIVNVRHSVEDLPGGTVWYAGVMAPNHPEYNPDNCYYSDAGYCWVYLQAPESEANMANVGGVYTDLFYSCAGVTNPKRLLVWKYSQTNFRIDRSGNGEINMRTEVLECGKYTTIKDLFGAIKSFKRAYENPGVYFYLKQDCRGISSDVYTMSGDIIPFDDQANEDQNARSMRIVSGRDSRQIYGVVLSQDYNLGGACSTPQFNYQQNPLPYPDGGCINTWDPNLNVPGTTSWTDGGYPQYMHLLNFDKNWILRTEGGVKLYSKDYVAYFQQSNPTCTPPIIDAWPGTPGDPDDPPLPPVCEIADGLSVVLPSTKLRLQPPGPAPNGIGTRWTPPYPPGNEENFARGDGGGSTFFNPFGEIISSVFSAVSPKQCTAEAVLMGIECIKKIEHNGTYYTILYTMNSRTEDWSCAIITGTRELNTMRSLMNGRIILRMQIIPTTP